MGVGVAAQISSNLIVHGMSPDMPVTIIENATLATQRILDCRLENLEEVRIREQVKTPALIVIGKTAARMTRAETVAKPRQPVLAAAV
jgi:uroporphyrin-III C-methyltransferase